MYGQKITIGMMMLVMALGASTYYYKDLYDSESSRTKALSDAIDRMKQYETHIKQQHQIRLERVNEHHNRVVAGLRDDVKRLHFEASKSILPTRHSDSKRPDEISFDREKLDRAIQGFRVEIQTLITRGAECEVDLDSGKEWASTLN